MKIIRTAVAIFAPLLLQASAFAGSLEGEYKGLSGKVGIYAMSSMNIAKNADGENYTVKFSGGRDLTYKSAKLANNKIQINDKGFMMFITISGDKASIEPGGAVFQRIKN